MTSFAKNKRTLSPVGETVHSRLRLIGLLLAAAAIALLLAGCPPPGAGGGVSKPSAFTTTVTGSVQDKEFSTGLSGVKVSALTAPANPENKPAESDADGNFTLQVKHSGTFKLAVGNATCYEDFTTADITASADGSHNARAIGLTAKPEPTGAARYTFTPKGPAADKKFKLTVNCVREIGNNEFNAYTLGGIIKAKAAAEGLNNTQAQSMITEISLPPTLTKVGDSAFSGHALMQGTLTVPRNVETIGNEAFSELGRNTGLNKSVVIVKFESGSRLKTLGDSAFQAGFLRNFALPDNIETIGRRAFYAAGFNCTPNFPKTFTIPAKVSKIGNEVLGFPRSTGRVFTTFEVRSDALAKPVGGSTPFPLGNDLFQNINSGITKITLPQAVYDSYTKAELQAIFGSGSTNYRKPDGTAYDFAGKS